MGFASLLPAFTRFCLSSTRLYQYEEVPNAQHLI